MPQARTRAFVLGQWRCGEQDKRVHLLSREHGRLLGLAPGACRMKSRFGATLELFTEADFIYYFKEERATVTLSRADPVQSRFDLVSRPDWIFYFSLMSEVLVRFLPLAHREDRVYRLTGAVLEAAEEGADPRTLSAYFLAWLLRIQGTMFDSAVCSRCRRDSPPRAWVRDDYRGILCPACRRAEDRELPARGRTFLEWARSHAPASLPALPAETAAEVLRLLARKVEHDGEFTLTSLRCLPEFQ